ncbi:hypothetical protein FJZ53_02420 [Candidatus Woesearchaeota archaeon]|nr:hypothetical protein [Candidatus Woesearchaeota archaeon]
MGFSYKGITLEGEDYKIKIACNDKKKYLSVLKILQEEKRPFLVEELTGKLEKLITFKGSGDLSKDYDIFERLIQELAE